MRCRLFLPEKLESIFFMGVFLMKNIVFIGAMLLSTSGLATTVDLTHPNTLIEKFQSCQAQALTTDDCLETKRIVSMIHHDVLALEDNQQQVGLDIMGLQNQIQAIKKQKTPDQKKLSALEEQLEVMLATVSWLESPK